MREKNNLRTELRQKVLLGVKDGAQFKCMLILENTEIPLPPPPPLSSPIFFIFLIFPPKIGRKLHGSSFFGRVSLSPPLDCNVPLYLYSVKIKDTRLLISSLKMFGHILGILEMRNYWIFYNKERYGRFKLFLIF